LPEDRVPFFISLLTLVYLLYLTYCGVGASNPTGMSCICTLTTHQAKATSDDNLQEYRYSDEKDPFVATSLSDETETTKCVEALGKVLCACRFLSEGHPEPICCCLRHNTHSCINPSIGAVGFETVART